MPNALPGCPMDASSPMPSMRPFGEAGDLDVDFNESDRPALVTSVLGRCWRATDPEYWWRQPVGVRTAALLRLAFMAQDGAGLPLRSACVEAACREEFEFVLPWQALPEAGAQAEAPLFKLADGRTITLRLPTGDDLRQWRAARPASRPQALRLILASLLLEGDAGPADETELSDALATLDPMVHFTVACQCPACGAHSEVGLDLESLALSRLAARQAALLLQVHRCAKHYGWTEAQVLAVPPSRRDRYLALIEEEA